MNQIMHRIKQGLTLPLAALALVVTSLSFSIFTDAEVMAAPINMQIVAMPHPDDERQAWSLIEGSSDNYKVFVYFTRGEQSSFCDKPSLQTHWNEVSPGVLPNAKWSTQCHNARISSTLGFLNTMSQTDSAIPGGFSMSRSKTVWPNSQGKSLGHVDAGSTLIQDNSAKVFYSSSEPFASNNSAKGRVIFFNLGDGDLTQAEVDWAIRSIRDNPSLYGLPSIPFYNIVGPYSNARYSNCYHYDHGDHRVIHQSLWNTNFNVSWQAGATCASDPDVKRTGTVSNYGWSNAVGMNGKTRVGALERYYGWLNSNDFGWSAETDQNGYKIFNKTQKFWVRNW